MKKRILSMLLAMAMLLGLMPLSVFAEATEPVVLAEAAEAAEAAAPTEEAEEVSLSAFYVNPLYADQVTEKDLQTAFAQNPPLYAGEAGSYGADYCTTPAEAAPVLRQAMEQREEAVTVPYVVPAEVLNTVDGLQNLCIEIFEQAFTHTGVPTQGDYLRWHYFSWSVSLRGTWNADNTAVNGDLSFAISYHSDAAQEAAVSTRVDALLAELNPTGSDYQKLKTVYDWMCENITYDYTNLNDPTYKLKFSAYAALINGTAVCQGYANLLYRLALEMGIDCRLIAGTSHGEGHAWNIAKLGGSYYNLDSTWDSSRTTYAYFLKSNANFDDHTRNSEYTTAAFNAAYPMGSSDYDPASEVPGNVVASGTCGENVTWVLTDDGTLTISGTGAMADYNCELNYCEAPWFDYREDITSVVVETGITSIGDGSFYLCTSLTSVAIPDSVTTIGKWAFYFCDSLTSITIPNGMTSISEGTFALCSRLSGITIPDSVTSIGDRAFDSCASLTNITIPDNVTSIGTAAFRECLRLTSVVIPASVTSIGNYAFYYCTSLTSAVIPTGVTTVEDFTFAYCYKLKSVTIPETVTGIGNYAFFYCESLTGVTIPDSVTSIGEMAFQLCGLSEIVIPASVTSIGYCAFYECTSLTEITFKGNAPAIGGYAFGKVTATAYYPAGNATWTEEVMQNYGGTITWKSYSAASEVASGTCGENLTWVLTDDGVLTISGTGAMADYGESEYAPWDVYSGDITSAVVGTGVTSIGAYAFASCRSLTSVTIPVSVTSIGAYAFAYCRSLTDITIPDSVTSIGDGTFTYCSSLTGITIPDSVTSIGNDAFYACKGLTNITIPDSVTSIGDGTFAGCLSLTDITIPGSVTSIGADAFRYCSSLTSVTIPVSVTSIGKGAFYGCRSLTNITIPDSVTSIGDGTFVDCSSLTNITIPDSVTSIGEGAFNGCSRLTNITIPDSVTSIGAHAFYACKGLTNITIPDSVTSIGEKVFSGCSGLTGITIPESVTSIGDYAFSRSGLREITISESVISIGEGAFASCSSLKGIWVSEGNPNYSSDESGVLFDKEKTTLLQCPGGIEGTYSIPGSVTSIGIRAFFGCKSLTNVSIPSSVTSVGAYAFASCSSLTDITIPDSVTSIGEEAFESCTSLTDITIPDSVTSIGDWAFEYCTSLTEITFKGNAPTIGKNAFYSVTATVSYPAGNATWTADVMQNYGGTITWKAAAEDAPGSIIASGTCGENLTWVLTNDGALTISGTGAMYSFTDTTMPWVDNCTRIKSVVVENGATSIGDFAFFGCENITSVTIPDSVTSIGNVAFDGCWSLTGIDLPNSLTSIGAAAFSRTGLTSVIIPAGVTAIGNDTFSLSGLTSVTIPESVTSIGSRAFYRTRLTSVTIPESVTSIGAEAFSHCASLTSINIPKGVTAISEEMFSHCTSLTSISIPEGVTSIGSLAFSACDGLTSITIPESVTSIGSYAFYSCAGLQKIVFSGNAPMIGTDAFINMTATAFYPDGNATWTADVMQNYGGTITWVAVAHEHEWSEWKQTKAPTCTEKGEETRTCDLCGETETRPVDMLDHTYESVVTAPTCTEKGYTTHTCTRCNDSYVDTYVDALGHKAVLQNVKDATCTEDGYTGDEICTVCGETVKKGEAIAALDHSFGEWKQTKAPTCTEKGEETHTCTVCGETETREVAALGHKLALVPGVAPDYAKPGMKAHYVCNTCGKLFADEAGTAEVTEEELVIPQLIQVENGKTEIGKEVIDSAAETVENGGEVKLPVADAGEVKSAALPVQSLTKVVDKEASLTVEMTAATVTMDTAALEAVARQSGEQDAVTLEVTEISKEDLTEAQQEAVKDKNVVSTISAQLLVNEQPIAGEADGGFGDGRVTVRIPFTPEAGTTAEDYKVLYVAADGTTTEISTTYEDGCLVIVLEHFSDYVIVKTKTVKLGDINGDGKINVTDLMCLANHFAGKAEINEANSDLDGNGKVNVTDLMRLANVFAGKATLG